MSLVTFPDQFSVSPRGDGEAERQLIAHVLHDPSMLGEVREHVDTPAFLLPENQCVWDGIVGLEDLGEPISPETLVAQLRANGTLEEAGGATRIESLRMNHSDRRVAVHLAKLISEHAICRDIQRRAFELGVASTNRRVTLDSLAAMARSLSVEASVRKPAAKAKLTDVADLVEAYPELREPIIEGLLRKGETLNVIASPKVGKTFLAIHLIACVSMGWAFLDTFATRPGRALYVDNELHPNTLASRLRYVASAMGINPKDLRGKITICSLRGELRDLYQLSEIFGGIKRDEYQLVVVDAFYRAIPAGVSENDNAQMAALYNQIDAYAAMLNAAFVMVHHTSKGSQTNKSITDTGAGAGAQSRAADTHLIIRPHKEAGAVVVEAVTRSWPPPDPFCLRFNHPTWTVAHDLDPAELKPDKPARRGGVDAAGEISPEDFARRFAGPSPRNRDAILTAAAAGGISNAAAKRLLNAAVDAGHLHTQSIGRNRAIQYSTAPFPETKPGAESAKSNGAKAA